MIENNFLNRIPTTHLVEWVLNLLEGETFTSFSSNSENRFLIFSDIFQITFEGGSSRRAGHHFWWLPQDDQCDQEGGWCLEFPPKRWFLFPQWPEQDALIESANWEIPGYATGVYHVLVHNGKVHPDQITKHLNIKTMSKGDVGTGEDHRWLRRA